MCIKIMPDPEGDFAIAPRKVDRLPPRNHFQRTPSTRYVSTELRSPNASENRLSGSTVLTTERTPRSSHHPKRSTDLRTPTRGAGTPRHSSHSVPASAPLAQIPDPKPAIPIPAGHKQEWVTPPPAPSPPSSTVYGSESGSSDAGTRVGSSQASRSPQMSEYKANRHSSTKKSRRRDDTPAPPKASSSTASNAGSASRHSGKASRDSRRSVIVDNGNEDRERRAIEPEDKQKRAEEERTYHRHTRNDQGRRRRYHV